MSEAVSTPASQAPATESAQAQNPATQTTPTGASAQDPAKSAAQEAMKKFKVRVDNQELEVDESELIKGYTHSRAAAKRLQEGNRAKAQAEKFIGMMKDKGQLFQAIKELGHDPRSLAEEYLSDLLKEEMLDPRERELKTTQAKLKAFEEAEAKRKEQEKKAEHDRLKAKFAKDYETQFMSALKESQLPQNKEAVAEMAKYIKRAANIGYQLSAADAAKLVREDIEARTAATIGESEAEVLVKMLGEKNLAKLREWEAKQLRDPKANLQTPEEQNEERRKRDPAQRMTPQQWRAFNRG